MLTTLQIKNFRMLQDFEVSKLGRVNLIVGKNNSGKSTVLEALRIFAGDANWSLLDSIAEEHGEMNRTRFPKREFGEGLPYSHFFSGRGFYPRNSAGIVIGEVASSDPLRLNCESFVEIEEKVTLPNGETIIRVRLEKYQAESNIAEQVIGLALEVSGNGRKTPSIWSPNSPPERLSSSPNPIAGSRPCSFIPTQLIPLDQLAHEWDKIALTEGQNFVEQALKIVEPDFESLVFVGSGIANLDGTAKRTAKVKLKNVDQPVPIGGMGDGMLRILQLVLKVFSAKGGFLLIDEFETGLHYSVQEKVWALLFDLAERQDVQVFATTHSGDCIESFAAVAENKAHIESVLFRIGRSVLKSDDNKIIATIFDQEKLSRMTQAEVEIR